ncbi:alpha/beta hydrolase family protein [Saccharothrix syringae]|uniref:hypothetical protein n=1 Tax=Saccharothrix syringae TaxID=103733 RepID=UPI0006902BC9|nr:hypothetical protein [Saccharothrix syringae]
MVRYALQRYNGDTSRVFVTGASSGAVFAGVPASCFATTDGSSWNSACANGQLNRTPREWGDLVRAAYPGHSGARPRVPLVHGTDDDTLRHPNFTEEIEQWTDVHRPDQPDHHDRQPAR